MTVLPGQLASIADIMRTYGMTRKAVYARARYYRWGRVKHRGTLWFYWADVDRSTTDDYLARND